MLSKLYLKRSVPRWVVLIVDLTISAASFGLSYFVIKQFEFQQILRGHFFYYTGLYSVISLLVFYFMRIHTGIIRYSNIHDMFRISVALCVSAILYVPAVRILLTQQFHINSLNLAWVLIINFFISFTFLVNLRIFIRGTYYYFKKQPNGQRENVLVYGSGAEAMLVKQAIESNSPSKFVVAGFIDINPTKVNSYIQQIKIFHLKTLPQLKKKKNITKLIMTNEQLAQLGKNDVIEKSLKVGIKVLTVPPSDQWVFGKLSLSQIQELQIEDLLQRDPIILDNLEIREELSGKSILVTGAAGSIGSEIVRQVMYYRPSRIILCDQAESDLHQMQLDIEKMYSDVEVIIFIASIRDRNRMEIVFRDYRPFYVFHAAAYKHVPMMENHPTEAILTNVLGTKILADLSVLYQVRKFLMISTDKAVNPTNIMGTSKRIAEMYVQALSNLIKEKPDADLVGISALWTRQFISKAINSKTKFITTRFGNVLGSNGSVIPLFKEQIRRGGPVTVTHPMITRYFMTIPEAVQLVLEAALMGQGSEIFIFDMGRPVKIVDLAYKMIRLSGLVPDEDIKVVFTGLRPGEKLFEELLNKEEATLPTHHEKIKVAKVVPSTYHVIREIEALIQISRQSDDIALVKKMKELVPEFKSNNSTYERLDVIQVSIENVPELAAYQ